MPRLRQGQLQSAVRGDRARAGSPREFVDMPPYLQRGKVPRKRHTAFRREDGGIYYEELIGNQGFRGPSTVLYRLHRPTEVLKVDLVRELKWDVKTDPTLRPYHFRL